MIPRRSAADKHARSLEPIAPALSSARLDALMEHTNDVVFGLDASGRVVFAAGSMEVLGLDPASEVGLPAPAIFVDEDMDRVGDLLRYVLDQPGSTGRVEARVKGSDDQIRTMDVIATNHLSDAGVEWCLITLRDITTRVAGERRLRETEALFESAFRNAPIGMAVQGRGGQLLQVNRALCNMLGYDEDDLVNANVGDITHPDDRLRPIEGERRGDMSGAGGLSYEKRFIRKDGGVLWAAVHVSLVRNDDGTPRFGVLQVEDVTEHRNLAHRLAHQEAHDALTGLPNRTAVMHHLNELLADPETAARTAVLFCDLDHFKLINDTLGHHVGDQLLEITAGRIRNVLRPSDVVGRFGGDEFVLVCQHIAQREDATAIANRVIDTLSIPINLEGEEFTLSASVGVAYAIDTGADANALLRNADSAMYRAKDAGRAHFEIYDRDHHEALVRRAEMERELRRGIDAGELVVYYQPSLDLRDGHLHGFEALVRWHHPTRGPMGPSEFIPLAEETRLIVPLGAAVLATACQHLALWRQRGVVVRDATVAVNVSGRQLGDPSLVATVRDVLERTGLPPAALCLEVTESVLLESGVDAGNALAALRELGVSLAIDDFGTGYSSLTHLKAYPFDVLKIDRGFTDGLGTDPNDEAIVAAVVGMADALDLWVVAEGIETETQLDVLRSYGVGLGQGYLFAKPMPALEVEWWLTDRLPAAVPR
jgi:diguanylate cyclase (GGDEF)-like protein/PAS domain S-box-containing protein